jgi:hypothetical protein
MIAICELITSSIVHVLLYVYDFCTRVTGRAPCHETITLNFCHLAFPLNHESLVVESLHHRWNTL